MEQVKTRVFLVGRLLKFHTLNLQMKNKSYIAALTGTLVQSAYDKIEKKLPRNGLFIDTVEIRILKFELRSCFVVKIILIFYRIYSLPKFLEIVRIKSIELIVNYTNKCKFECGRHGHPTSD